MTRAEVRTNLIENAKAFLSEGCWYSTQEKEIIEKLVEWVVPVNEDSEKYNEKHPNHGTKIADGATKDFSDDWKNKPLK